MYVAPHLIRKILCQYARLVIKRLLTILLSTAYLYLGEYFQDFVSRSLSFFFVIFPIYFVEVQPHLLVMGEVLIQH